MEKRNFEIRQTDSVELKFQGKIINVIPYLSQETQFYLSSNYIDFSFGLETSVENFYQAEWSLILGIINSNTDIKVAENEGNVDLDVIICSGLWDEIRSKIVNYNEFRGSLRELYNRVSEERALEKSFGQALNNITNKITGFIDKISEVDLSEKGLAELKSGLDEQLDKINKVLPSESAPMKKKRTYNKKEK